MRIIYIFSLLTIFACVDKKHYRLPREFQNENLINGTTKTFTDSLTKDCLAIFEKIEIKSQDTLYTKVEFNDRQIFDSTFGVYGQQSKVFKLDTEYGLLNGTSKILDQKESERSSSTRTEVNFLDKILSVIRTEKTWTYLDERTILEVVKNNISYVDKVKGRHWEINSMDSIYYGKSIGLQKMRLFFMEENQKIDFNLIEVSISTIRQKNIHCELK